MDENTKKMLEELRALGVKSAGFDCDAGSLRLNSVEFFEHAPPFPRLDADTLVPPPPEGEPEARVAKVPPALSRLLKNGSIS